MSKAPVPPNELKRIKALNSYNILDTLAEAEFDELTKLASQICGTPVALVSLVDKNRQWFKSKVGTDVPETPRDQSFCAHAILNPSETLIVQNARLDYRFADNPLVTGDPNIVFYAGVPLINEDGFALGSLCVIDREERVLTAGQLEALEILTKQVMAKLEIRRKVTELERLNTALLESNLLIQQFARTAAHDIKNPISSIMLTSQLLERVLPDAKHRELASKNVQACKQLIGLIEGMLSYAKSPAMALMQQDEISLNELLDKVICLLNVPANVFFDLPAEPCIIKTSAVAMEQIFLNLLSNSIRYNDKPQVRIKVQYRDMDGFYELKVSDNGTGISPEHLERIFEERFTSGLTDRFQQQGTGIGLHTVRALVKTLSGTITAESVLGEYTKLHLRIPKA